MGLDGTLWRREFTKDVWELARQAILHMCGPSCWKYNKVKSKYGEKVTRTCRHECFHSVQVPEQVKNPEAKPRLVEGKRLRATVTILEDAETNMKGRVLPIQTQPFEGRTQYYGLACLRCNWDVQDVRCILPGLLTDLYVVSSTLLLGFSVGRLLGLSEALVTLISTGSAICGCSAVAATQPIINAEAHEVAAAVGVVVLCGTLAMFIYPALFKVVPSPATRYLLLATYCLLLAACCLLLARCLLLTAYCQPLTA